jgi:hypothetical protein
MLAISKRERRVEKASLLGAMEKYTGVVSPMEKCTERANCLSLILKKERITQ